MDFEKFMAKAEEREKKGEGGEATNIAGETKSVEKSTFRFTEEEREEKKERGMSDVQIDEEERLISERQMGNKDAT